MKKLVALLSVFVALVAIVTPARAALIYDGWATGPGGLSIPYPTDTPQVFAGFIELNYNGNPVLMMSADYNARDHIGDSWQMTLYTYADVQNGAPVRFNPVQYSRAAWALDLGGGVFDSPFIINYIAENYAQALPLFAEVNAIVWKIMDTNSIPSLVNRDLAGVYESAIDGTHDTFNWSQNMLIAYGGPNHDEYLIPIAGTSMVVAPVPPAAWLLGSGLIGLVGVAKKKKTKS